MDKSIVIRIIEPTIVGGAHADAGTIHTISEEEGLLIIGCGRAVRHVPAANEQAVETPPVVETAEAAPVAETAIAAPPTRRRRQA